VSTWAMLFVGRRVNFLPESISFPITIHKYISLDLRFLVVQV